MKSLWATAARVVKGEAADRGARVLSETAAGVYALEAVAGLRGERILAAGWVGGGVLVAALALAGAAVRPRTRPSRLGLELALVTAGGLAALLLPGWSAGWGGRVWFVVLARTLAGGLRWAARAGGMRPPNAVERLRLLLLGGLAAISLHAYLTPQLVGPKDARWYGIAVTDFLAQIHAGVFPVLAGATAGEFNGMIQLVRSAPAHLYGAALVDALTLHGLAPLAVQHVVLVAGYLAAVLGFYLALVRLRSAARWTALLLAVCYGTSPALMQPLVEHDMFMTFLAAPVLVFLLHALVRAGETRAPRAFAWVGAACAALWLCHPPLALLGLVLVLFWVGAQVAIEGPGRRLLAGAAVAAFVFAVLAAPYFAAMAEIPPTHPYDPWRHLVLPGLALFLLVAALGRLLRRGGLLWLSLLAAAGLILASFRPSLLPFSAIFLALFAAAATADRHWPRLALRARPEPWLLVCFFFAAAAAARWFPGRSLPAAGTVEQFLGPAAPSVAAAWGLIVRGSDCQPSAAWWFLLAAAAALVWTSRDRSARLGVAAALVAVAAIFPVPLVKTFLWSNTTVEIWDTLSVADPLRLWPFVLPLLLVAAFLLLAALAERRRGWHRAAVGALLLLLPGVLATQDRMVRGIFTRTAGETARLFRPENTPLQVYDWDLLHIPSYWSAGVMDYRLETRLWRQGGDRALLIGPDAIARSMEVAGADVLTLQATQDPTYPQWLYLAPRIVLPPGETKLVRFDFLGRALRGWLILRGGDFYRDYPLPSSGYEHAFGSGPSNSRTLSLWNSGPAAETIELVVKREGPDATAPAPTGVFARVTVSHYDASRAPIEVKSLLPLVLRVEAPAPGVLELFRSSYPGYRVDVNGRAVPYAASREGLVAFAVPAGGSEVLVRFRGTPWLRVWFWYGLAAWSAAALALGAEMATAGGSRRAGVADGR